MSSPSRDDEASKPATMASEEVGEPSRPDDAPPDRQPGHHAPARPSAPPPSRPKNGGGRNPSTLPQAGPLEADDGDGRSNGYASSVSVPNQSGLEEPKHSPKAPSIDNAADDTNTVHRTSEDASSLARADSTDSRRPPPRPLDAARSVRNKAPTSPMPLYAQQLLSGPLLSPFVPDHVDSEEGDSDKDDDNGYIYTSDISQTLASLKRKRPREETHHRHRRRAEPTVADADVVAATRDVLVLLQMYGPMTHVQLKVNIETQLEDDEEHSSSGGSAAAATVAASPLQKVLDILVELGVIRILKDNAPAEVKDKVSTTSAAAAGSKSVKRTNNDNNNNNDSNPMYCFGDGARRMDSILPSETLQMINEAGDELIQTQQRIQMLRSFLNVETSPPTTPTNTTGNTTRTNTATTNTTSESGSHDTKFSGTARPPTHEAAKTALRQMTARHPDVVHDPTYAAALRLFKLHDVVTKPTTDGTVAVSKKGGEKPTSTEDAAIAESGTAGGGNESTRED